MCFPSGFLLHTYHSLDTLSGNTLSGPTFHYRVHPWSTQGTLFYMFPTCVTYMYLFSFIPVRGPTWPHSSLVKVFPLCTVVVCRATTTQGTLPSLLKVRKVDCLLALLVCLLVVARSVPTTNSILVRAFASSYTTCIAADPAIRTAFLFYTFTIRHLPWSG